MAVLSSVVVFIFLHAILLQNFKFCAVDATSDNILKNTARIEFHANHLKDCGKMKTPFCDTLTFESHDYVMFPNKTIYVLFYNLKLNECSYILKQKKVIICRSLIYPEFDLSNIPCGVKLALCISLLSVFFPLFFSMLTEDVRELVHVNWRGLILCVFFFHFLLQIVNLDQVSEMVELRYTFPSLMHFFTLVLLSWMTILSHDGMMLSESMEDQNQNYLQLMRNFRGHMLSIITTIILVITVTLAVEAFGIFPSILKPKSEDFCWLTQRTLLLFFSGPVFVFSLINFISFMTTYVYFTQHRRSLSCPLLVLRKNYLVHFKLFVVLDITWFVGILLFLTGSELLWRIFIGIFIIEETFIIVVPFNKNMEKWVLKKLSGD